MSEPVLCQPGHTKKKHEMQGIARNIEFLAAFELWVVFEGKLHQRRPRLGPGGGLPIWSGSSLPNLRYDGTKAVQAVTPFIRYLQYNITLLTV